MFPLLRLTGIGHVFPRNGFLGVILQTALVALDKNCVCKFHLDTAHI